MKEPVDLDNMTTGYSIKYDMDTEWTHYTTTTLPIPDLFTLK